MAARQSREVAIAALRSPLLSVEQLRTSANPRADLSGLYFLFDGDELVYVGRSTVAMARLYDHTRTKKFSHVAFCQCSPDESLVLESRYVHAYRPRYNLGRNGMPIGVVPSSSLTDDAVSVRLLPRQTRLEMAQSMANDKTLTAVEISRATAIDQATINQMRKPAKKRVATSVTLAVSHLQRTGCTPAAAAQRYGVAVSSVRRALARLGVEPRPVGRPAKKPSYV